MVKLSPIQSLGLCLAGSSFPQLTLIFTAPGEAVEARLSSFLPAFCPC